MNRTIRLAALAVMLAAATPASAQPAQQPRVGLGIGLPTADFTSFFGADLPVGGVVTPQVYVPINVTPNFRIEPQFGVLTSHDDATDTNRSYKSVGAGVFWRAPLGGQVSLYLGPRVVLSFFNDRTVAGNGVVTKSHATDIFFAAALGGEVAVHPRFSVGAEGQLSYTSLGDLHVDEAGTSFTTSGGSSWATQGILFVRVYLF